MQSLNELAIDKPLNPEAPGMPGSAALKQWVQTWTFEKSVCVLIIALIGVRLLCAANIPLAFDEALYWRYSKHLAAGFLDHPFMNPLMIRLGTSIFGDTPLGVRFFSVMLGLPASWAVWRAASILFSNNRIGATAALFLNLTVAMSLGSMLATSDQVVVTTSCFVLYFLSRLNESGRGEWWLAVGAAFGLGMCSKYTTLFFGVSIFAWLIIVPELRKWLVSPWSWAGAAIALLIFSPVLMWNADHHWASFMYQSKRMVVHAWTLKYLGEFIFSQFGLATPPLFALGCISLFWGLRQPTEPRPARILLAALIWPFLLYFSWHAIHERVQGNWPEAMFPALMVACACAAHQLQGRTGRLAQVAYWSRRCAVPLGLTLAIAVSLQAIFGILPLGPTDPSSRMLGVGWPELAAKIDRLRDQSRARVILTTDYHVNSWLAFYLPTQTPVEQVNQRIRWANEPEPGPGLFSGTAIYVCRLPCVKLPELAGKYASVVFLDTLARVRHGVEIEKYSVYRLTRPRGPTLDPVETEWHAGASQ